jgi:hypothetical protein
MDLDKQIVITRVGPANSRPFEFENATPLRIEVEIQDGSTTILTLSPRAAAALAAELPLYVNKHLK